MEREEQFLHSVTYSDVARAISRNFSRIFCVNTETDAYVEFIPHENDKRLDIRAAGKNFKEIVLSFEALTCVPDQDTFRTAVTKQNVLNVLQTDDSFTLDFRMMIDGKPTYMRLKATRLSKEDPSHILFALSNTDAHMQRLSIYDRAMSNNLTFAAISEALTADYACIFYVNTQTNEYIEYSSSELYKQLRFDTDGEDFFKLCSEDLSRIVYEEDRALFLRAFQKENLMQALSVDHVFFLTFRIILEKDPIYVRVKVSQMNHIDDHHIVLGLSNIDANMQRVQEYEKIRAIANYDSLTGVKSKHAFKEYEEHTDREISEGAAVPFALVVCDVNGLKKINDTLGHKAGDDYLRRSCKMICTIFSHSPVYRVGGDEFVAVLMGQDFENRSRLMRELHSLSALHIGTEEGVVSGGLAEYAPGQDHCISEIFERADAKMYEEKMLLKSLGAAVRENEAEPSAPDTEDIPIINVRKHILIADDQQANRELLGSFLEKDYDILYASGGVETLEMLRKHKDETALLLLDLYMPDMSGREVLRDMQVDEDLMSIPVIMLTVDHDAELDSLKRGAMDFISKPYPDIEIVKARIAKCIELSENRDLIKSTQRDKLTGLLHYDYFIKYVERFEQQHKENDFDALACDISRFRSINEQYGRQFGDLVLRSIGNKFRKLARKTGGIGCRQGADTFYLYCPHRSDYEQLILNFKTNLFVYKDTEDKINLRFGIFEHAQEEPDIEKIFAKAKAAADLAANDPELICGYYDSAL